MIYFISTTSLVERISFKLAIFLSDFAVGIKHEQDNHLFIMRTSLVAVRMIYSSSTNSLDLAIVFTYLPDYELSDFVITDDRKLMFALDVWSQLQLCL